MRSARLRGAPLGVCLFVLSLLFVSAVVGCQNNGPVGGPVVGPIDNHCYIGPDGGPGGGPISPTPIDPDLVHGACALQDAGPNPPPPGPQYGPTMYNSSSNDDDCKYQVGWWSTPIQQGKVTFWVSNVFTTTGLPMDLPNAAANSIAEVFLSDTHPAPNASQQVTTEVDAGVYMIGPVTFDKPGTWTVRFHFNEECFDVSPNSPHGHAAFFVNVP
jgi:hypothetical protein